MSALPALGEGAHVAQAPGYDRLVDGWARALGHADRCTGAHRLHVIAREAETQAAAAHPGFLARFDGRRAAHRDVLIRRMLSAYAAGMVLECPLESRAAPEAGASSPLPDDKTALPAGGSGPWESHPRLRNLTTR